MEKCLKNVISLSPRPLGPRGEEAGGKGRESMLTHPIAPVYAPGCTVLVLGSFPSAASREAGFFYGHPQNRFWRVLAGVWGAAVPETVPEKRDFLLSHGVALWDVIGRCDIQGSADSSIKNVVPNDLSPILSACPAVRIFTNGKKAQALYDRYLRAAAGREAVCLPSTSPANAAWRLPQLIEAWSVLREGR